MRILGPLEFKYAGSTSTYALTAVPDDVSGQRQVAIITLVDASFAAGQQLDEKFIIIHELGHVFHNRHGNATNSDNCFGTDQIVCDYVDATLAHWLGNPPIIQGDDTPLRGVDPIPYTNEEGMPLDINGKLTSVTGQPQAYIFPSSFWIAGDYIPPALAGFFPNEISHPSPHPKEGFADTFANLIIRGTTFIGTDERGQYFADIETWIDAIINAYP